MRPAGIPRGAGRRRAGASAAVCRAQRRIAVRIRARAVRLTAKAEGSCLVARSMKTEVVLEPRVDVLANPGAGAFVDGDVEPGEMARSLRQRNVGGLGSRVVDAGAGMGEAGEGER